MLSLPRWARRRLSSACALVAAFVASCASAPPPKTEPSALLDRAMPGFEVEPLNSSPRDSGSFYGRPLVLTFVEDDCAPCDQSLSAAQSIYSEDHDLVVVAVFAGDRDSAGRSARRQGLRFPVAVDGEGDVARRFEVTARPRTFVVDAQGRVRWVGGAALTEEGLQAAIRAAR
jgi:peroxiredoxin